MFRSESRVRPVSLLEVSSMVARAERPNICLMNVRRTERDYLVNERQWELRKSQQHLSAYRTSSPQNRIKSPLSPSIRRAVDRRIHERHPAYFQVRVAEVDHPESSASGQAVDISESGIGVYLPLQFTPGSAVRLNINDKVLYGFVAHSTPERSYFRTGIEVVQVLIGGSDLSQLLQTTLEEVMPDVEWSETLR